MSRNWLSILVQAAIVVVSLGGFWLFLELYKGDAPTVADGDWFPQLAGLLVVLTSGAALWAARTYFAPSRTEDEAAK